MNYQDVYNKIKNDGLSQILLADIFYKNGKRVIPHFNREVQLIK